MSPLHARRQSIVRSLNVAGPPDEVWALVGDFGGIHRWNDGVPAPELRTGGRVPERVFGAGTGQELTEVLVERDQDARRIVYRMPAPPFPISDHEAWMEVAPSSAGSLVTWTATFLATDAATAELEKVLGDGVFAGGLASLARTCVQA